MARSPRSAGSDYSFISSPAMRSISSLASTSSRAASVAPATTSRQPTYAPAARQPTYAPTARRSPASLTSSPPPLSRSVSRDSSDEEYDDVLLSCTSDAGSSLVSSLVFLSLSDSSDSVADLDPAALDASNAHLRMPSADVPPRSDTATPRASQRRGGHRQHNARARHGAGSFELVDVYDSDDAYSNCGESVAGTRPAESVMSTQDARSSIDQFLAAKPSSAYMRDSSNRLRLYQALCVELGLVQLADEPRSPGGSSSSRCATPTGRAAASRPHPAPFPHTVSQARYILQTRGHVNLCDYFEARKDRACTDGEDLHDRVGAFAHLVYPTAEALRRASIAQDKIYPLRAAKREWLQPLLRGFF